MYKVTIGDEEKDEDHTFFISPKWMYKYIFPCYDELWGIVKAAGNMDAYADDVMKRLGLSEIPVDVTKCLERDDCTGREKGV